MANRDKIKNMSEIYATTLKITTELFIFSILRIFLTLGRTLYHAYGPHRVRTPQYHAILFEKNGSDNRKPDEEQVYPYSRRVYAGDGPFSSNPNGASDFGPDCVAKT